jgi:hypothetical protein
MPTAEEMLAEEEAKQAIEWGTYVATGPIDIDGVRAFSEGFAVPVSHVTRGLVDESQVRRVSDAPPEVPAVVPAVDQAVPAANPEVA